MRYIKTSTGYVAAENADIRRWRLIYGDKVEEVIGEMRSEGFELVSTQDHAGKPKLLPESEKGRYVILYFAKKGVWRTISEDDMRREMGVEHQL